MESWWIHLSAMLVCSVEDWHCKKISLWKIIVYEGLILLMEAGKTALGKQSFEGMWRKCVYGALPGLFFLFLSRVTKEQLGYGDDLLILIAGISLGIWKITGILLLAFAGTFIRAVYLFSKGTRKAHIAFLPFLLAGMAVVMLWEWEGKA